MKELLSEKNDALARIDCIGFKEESNQKLLKDKNSFLEQHYDLSTFSRKCRPT